MKMADQEYIMK